MPYRQQYGLRWDELVTPLEVELRFVRAGGFIDFQGWRYGRGPYFHHRAAISILWPEDDHHRWSDLMLETFCTERLVVVQGPRDCSKTRTYSKWALVDFWSAPEETLTIMTSTGIRELELRVWGDIKSLYTRAKDYFPWLAGNMNQANHAIFTDALDERGDVRDMRRGLVCVPMITGEGAFTGLENFAGIKQNRRRIIGDELQFIPVSYLNVFDAFDKGDFKTGLLGNPMGGNGKALDRVAEPVGGWSTLPKLTKTTTWRNKYGGITINLVGTDSPNFDRDRPKDYPYLIDQTDIDKIVLRNGVDSPQYWTLALGVRQVGAELYRVIPYELCERSHAFDTPIWASGPFVKILAIDAGFGGDPCELMFAQFANDVAGNQILEFHQSEQIPIDLLSQRTPEEQIALAVKAKASNLGVPDANIFFDAGMRATLAVDMAKYISAQVNAVNFGGPATERPVSQDAFVTDPKTRERRLLKCSEQYSKFVTELWYSVRELVDAHQARGLPKDAAQEFSNREWRWVPGPLGMRYELETKPEYKTRTNSPSPNKADVASIALEGARRLGFQIKNLAPGAAADGKDNDWLERAVEKEKRFRQKHELKFP